ncbi:MAG TPA: hypothetical protein VEX68_07885 [Bryobacteraceae bacterium]|nr:hypothetical protein [Bryobacteraceae bacterium]
MLAIADVKACCVGMHYRVLGYLSRSDAAGCVFASDSVWVLKPISAVLPSPSIPFEVGIERCGPGGGLKTLSPTGLNRASLKTSCHQTNNRRYPGAILLIRHASANEFVGLFSCRTARYLLTIPAEGVATNLPGRPRVSVTNDAVQISVLCC